MHTDESIERSSSKILGVELDKLFDDIEVIIVVSEEPMDVDAYISKSADRELLTDTKNSFSKIKLRFEKIQKFIELRRII